MRPQDQQKSSTQIVNKTAPKTAPTMPHTTPLNNPNDSKKHLADVKTEQQKAEIKEVTGRHRNDGQKDHKGAR